ncbi:phosphate acetyltransferase [Enterobacteriaceae endosymbiont of Neohaemonia nigricornis]|uniref:phosphate acetyltransferase n=1 Tax=Enterobacteriaceae endosymbiont of Neohaemonia nigricornis TaxID=2675792 RepID=UPI001B3B135C|nr:phosphate acetyltransferase [Enterobacteriaceae endosymbiont of Neohaemonia nigricornis]
MSIPVDIDIDFFQYINISLIKNIKSYNNNLKFFNPISYIENFNLNKTQTVISNNYNIECIKSISVKSINMFDDINQYNEIIQNIIINFSQHKDNTDIIFIEGIFPICLKQFIFDLNCKIANIFRVEILFITAEPNNIINNLIIKKINILFKNKIYDFNINKTYIFVKNFNINNNLFFNIYNKKYLLKQHKTKLYKENIIETNNIFNIYNIPFNKNNVLGLTIKQIYKYLSCYNINVHFLYNIKNIVFIYEELIFNEQYANKYLFILSIKNNKLIQKICDLLSNTTYIKNLLITDINHNSQYDKTILKQIIYNKNINIAYTTDNNLILYKKLKKIPIYNTIFIKEELLNPIIQYLSKYIPKNIFYKKNIIHNTYDSPEFFKNFLIQKASKMNKTILLPEGNEIRTIKAALICGEKYIAKCILLGNVTEILNIINKNHLLINDNIKIIDPAKIRNNYIEALVDIRKHKGLNIYDAKKLLLDNMVLATMMLKEKQVDGIVAGASTTTANTIRPALQIIKTSTQYSLISSIFFMLLPTKVLIYSDCAINPNPNYKQLAEIAIQSEQTARYFNIQPKIAMISYATGNSSRGIEVEKVYKATQLVHKKYPHILIDGPLQYDAAVDKNIGKYKAINSNIAGTANVIIFPDLNTGNTTYKAVQRSSNIISIGPILQGIQQPVNDLSRGASVEDIIYTIAATVIQSEK